MWRRARGRFCSRPLSGRGKKALLWASTFSSLPERKTLSLGSRGRFDPRASSGSSKPQLVLPAAPALRRRETSQELWHRGRRLRTGSRACAPSRRASPSRPRDILACEERYPLRLSGEDEWWAWMWSHGTRSLLEVVPGEEREALRRALVLELLAAATMTGCSTASWQRTCRTADDAADST